MDKVYAKYSNKKAQLKIQQMAFVLAAIIIFFALVGLVYFSIMIKNLEKSAVSLKEEEAKELVKKLAGSPEFSYEDCANCVDLDKVLALKDRDSYDDFWNLNYLAVRVDYPKKSESECSLDNYPNCRGVVIIDNEEPGIVESAFVSVCRWSGNRGYRKCEIGKILASGEGIG